MRFYITPFNLSCSYSGFYVPLRNPIVKWFPPRFRELHDRVTWLEVLFCDLFWATVGGTWALRGIYYAGHLGESRVRLHVTLGIVLRERGVVLQRRQERKHEGIRFSREQKNLYSTQCLLKIKMMEDGRSLYGIRRRRNFWGAPVVVGVSISYRYIISTVPLDFSTLDSAVMPVIAVSITAGTDRLPVWSRCNLCDLTLQQTSRGLSYIDIRTQRTICRVNWCLLKVQRILEHVGSFVGVFLYPTCFVETPRSLDRLDVFFVFLPK